MELIDTDNQYFIIGKALTVKEHLENELKKKFNDKSTYIYSMMIDIATIIDIIVDAPITMEMSHITMSTQVNHKNINKGHLIRVPY